MSTPNRPTPLPEAPKVTTLAYDFGQMPAQLRAAVFMASLEAWQRQADHAEAVRGILRASADELDVLAESLLDRSQIQGRLETALNGSIESPEAAVAIDLGGATSTLAQVLVAEKKAKLLRTKASSIENPETRPLALALSQERGIRVKSPEERKSFRTDQPSIYVEDNGLELKVTTGFDHKYIRLTKPNKRRVANFSFAERRKLTNKSPVFRLGLLEPSVYLRYGSEIASDE